MRHLSDIPASLAGSLLVAHPSLRDPNFRRTVILMTTHGPDGAMGVVLNRPLKKRLGQLGGDFALGELSDVPLFTGGPVQTEQLIIAAWKVHPSGFQLHLGIELAKATQLMLDDGAHVRAFFGYSGWSAGQLENELKANAWVIVAPPTDLFTQPGDAHLWSSVLRSKGSDWRLMADEPEETGSN